MRLNHRLNHRLVLTCCLELSRRQSISKLGLSHITRRKFFVVVVDKEQFTV